jgi:hypothetical protein
MPAKKTTSKPKSPSSHAPIGPALRLFRGPTGPFALVLLIAAGFFGAWCVTWYGMGSWQGVRQHVFSSPEYWVGLENVEISRQPPWIRTDIRSEVFRDASLDGPLSIMDPDLVERVANAFSLHPWISEVRGVTKRHPASIKVDLEYRLPVCMVEGPRRRLSPVDSEGILLPRKDFSPLEAGKYPLLTGIDTVPVGPEGTNWGDARVLGGAEIAAVLGPVWSELGLERIVPSPALDIERPDETIYELFTKGGTRIVWGRAPSCDMPGEVPAADKVERLKRYFAENNTLEGPAGRQEIDVRSLRSLYVAPSTAGFWQTKSR